MERKLLYFLVFLNFFLFSNSTRSDIKEVFTSIGVYDIANIANYEIIPKLKFVLPTIPDSVWVEYEIQYDSAKLSQRFENIFSNYFNQNEIADYQKLAKSLMQDYFDTSLPRFEYFLNKMDSIRIFIKDADTILSKFKIGKLSELQIDFPKQLNLDSLVNEAVQSFIQGKAGTKIAPTDSLAKFYQYFADSILKKYFQEPKPFPEIPQFHYNPFLYFNFDDFNRYLKENQEYLNHLKEQAKILNDYISRQGKILKEYQDLLKKYLKDLSSKKNKSQKELDKKLKELQNKFEQLNEEFEKKFKDLEKKYKHFEQRFNDINLNRERNSEDSYTKLKNLVEKHNKFINNLILVKKQIEMEILQDLQKKGFINVEVPQN